METTPNENNRLATTQDMLLLKEDLDALGTRIDQLFKNQLMDFRNNGRLVFVNGGIN